MRTTFRQGALLLPALLAVCSYCISAVTVEPPCSPRAVRLVGGSNQLQGRVEVCYNGRWGTVCEDRFNTTEANVVCRMLGYSGRGATVQPCAAYGKGTGPITLDDLFCFGYERHIFDCRHRSFNFHDCGHEQDVGVTCQSLACTQGAIRLMGGSNEYQGRVEVCNSGQWGTVCDDDFGTEEAKVVCRQLGFSDTGSSAETCHASFGEGTGRIVLDNVVCSGSETSLFHCRHRGINVHDCGHDEDVGVICGGGTPSDFLVYSNDRYLRKTFLNGTKLEDLLVSNGSVRGFDFDARNDYLFWSDVRFGQISRSRMDGSDVQILVQTGLNFPDGIAWDWVNKKLYWTDLTDDDIEVFDPVTKYRKVLFETGSRSLPRAIVVDPSIRMMYWTDWGSSPKIEKASMDGTLRTVIHSTGLVWPNGITLDYTTQTLYWVDASLDRMESSDVNGLNRRVLLTAGIDHPYGIDIFQGTLFWTDDNRRAILSADVAQPNNSRVIVPNVRGATMVIKAVSLERQQPAANPCGGRRCSHLCLLSASEVRGFSCACPTGMVLLPDGLICHSGGTTCTRLSSPTGGAVTFSSSSLSSGTIATYTCYSGYSLVGSSSRMCLSSGSWSGSQPYCQRQATCSRLSSIPNGTVTFSSSSLSSGTIATYTCDSGYSLVGPSSRTCIGGFYWSGSPPSCRYQALTCTQGDVRLVGGSSVLEGRVEVCNNNAWGTVCDDFWDLSDGNVVCRQLGYGPATSAPRQAFYGQGTGAIVLDDLRCNGTESSLFDCTHRRVGTHDCRHSEDAGVRCTSDVTSEFLVYSNDRYLRKTFLNGTRIEDLRVSTGSLRGVDFDARNDYLFWSDVTLDQISRSHMNGSNVQILVQTGIKHSDGIAWDWVNKKLYWTDLEDDDIEVFDPDTNYRKVLFETGRGSQPRGIVVDPSTRMMYWTDWGTSPKIEKASMDGTLRTVIHSTGLVWPNGITLDYTTQTLYWVDASLDRMESSDVNGLNRRVLLTAGIDHPYGIDVFQGKLFWTDNNRGAILSAHVAQPNNSRVIVPNVRGIALVIKVVSLERQKPAANPCGRSRCSHLCLLSASEVRGFSCACPTGMVLLPDGLFCRSGSTTCTRLSSPPGGAVTFSSSSLSSGTIATYTCYSGYSLVGSSSRICLSSGSWNGSQPYCQRQATCSRLSSPPNGTVTFSSSSLSSGTIATYTCDSGYSLVGSSSRTCIGGFYWSGSPPSCRYQALTCTQGDVRLVGGSSELEGRVEVCNNNAWGTVCDDFWDLSDGNVVCRQLGYGPATSAPGQAFYGEGTGAIVLDDLKCTGTESSLFDCTHRTLGTHDCRHYEDAGVRCTGDVTSEFLVYSNDRYLRKTFLNGTRIEDLRVSTGSIRGVDFDARNDYLFWSDVTLDQISRSHMNGSDVQILVRTGIKHSDGIAWDWVNKKLYWTDLLDDDIEVFDPDTNYRKVLFETGPGSQPRGIVVDPSIRMMYWTDWGTSPKIEKASMDGTLRTVIHSTGLVWPNGITLDYTTQTLYWIDASLDRIESSDVNGLNRRVLLTAGIDHPYGIDVFQGKLFWTDNNRGAILSAHVAQPNNSRVIVPNVRGIALVIKVVSLERQQPAANPCGRSRCSHLCLLSASEVRGFTCACPTGMVLLPDGLFCRSGGTTCTRLSSPPGGAVTFSSSSLSSGTIATYSCDSGYSLVGSSSRICLSSGSWNGSQPYCQRQATCSRLFSPSNGAVTFSSSSLSSGTIATYTCDSGYSLVGSSSRTCIGGFYWSGSRPSCRYQGDVTSEFLVYSNDRYLRKTFLNGTKIEDLRVSTGSLRGVDFDARNDYLFWSDVVLNQISRSHMNGSNVQVLVRTGIKHSDGIAWDWVNKKLYWTDQVDDDIEVFDPDTNYRKVLFKNGVGSQPRAIVVDPSTRTMYWTDWGTIPKIEKASMDGTLRTVIHSTGLIWPNGLALDYTTQTLYWVDASLDLMESSHVNGLNRRVLITAGIDHPYGIDVFQGKLFWTDDNRRAILSAPVAQPNNSRVIVPNVRGAALVIKVVSLERQQPATNPCVGSLCSHFCLLSASEVRGFSCACPTGMVLSPDGIFCRSGNTTCTRLSRPSNGVVRFSSSFLTAGTTARYSCYFGYSLVGSSSRTCLSSGLWSGVLPFCRRLISTCSRLSSPSNGAVTFSSSSLSSGTIARYTCDSGYSLVGSSSRTCRSSGSWSGSPPYCRLVSLPECEDLGSRCFFGSCSLRESTCIDGYCRCIHTPNRDNCTCLASIGDCVVTEGEVTTDVVGIPTFRDNPQTNYSCVANENCNYDVHMIGNYEGDSVHGFFRRRTVGTTRVDVRVTGVGTKPLVLVFSSYEPVKWILNVPTDVVIDKIILASYFISDSSVVYHNQSFIDIEKQSTRTIPCGYGSDFGGCNTVKQLEYVVRRFGPVASYSGSYRADHWTLNIDRDSFTPGCDEVSTAPTPVSLSTPALAMDQVCIQGEVRRSDNRQGYVEACKNGKWRLMCDDRMDFYEKLTCVQMVNA